ncbi:hypothetical protein VTH06DRAFT_2523 [Thermothelomyces fergusii]
MSSVPQEKTAPPGSWLWDKGEDATAQAYDTAKRQSAATPRSPPAVPEYQGFNNGSSVGEPESGEYTHRNDGPGIKEETGKGGGEVKEEPVESKEEPVESKEEPVESKEEPVESKEEPVESKEEPVESKEEPTESKEEPAESKQEPIELKDVEPKPVDEKQTGQVGEDVKAPVKAGPDADLAEDVNKTFGRTSENYPTSDVRETHLEPARRYLDAPQTEPPQSQDGEETGPENKQPEQQATIQGEPEKPAGQSPEEQYKGEEAEAGTEAEAEAAAAEGPRGGEQTEPDLSVLKDGIVNKGGNIVSPDGTIVGRVIEGEVRHLVGSKADADGNIWNDSGRIVGRAEPIPDSERDALMKEPAPFEGFPDAVVGKDGMVVLPNGDIVGRLVQGDRVVLRGMSVDPDGDVLDKGGNVIGRAERWEPEPEKEPEPEPEVDKSVLAGKRVNKAGNVVDGSGAIFGRVVEGDIKRMVGRMCDKKGNILSESGDVLGKADLVPEGEREGLKEGPFAELQGCTVAKDGTVVTPAGEVVGRLTSGDPKILFGRAVDEDGDILDKNGNTIGHAERWEPEQVEHKKNPMSGRRVNREGNVYDEDGNLIGKLTSGDLTVCSGKEIDDDGDVVDYKGNTVGHCSLLEDIPKEEEESPEEKEKREQAERDKKLAVQMAVCIEQCLDSIRPICKMITEKIDRAERTPEDERDEEALVREVRPLIEEGGRILNEAKGIIKGLDPDGRISANAKHKTAAREATPEEYHLADVLKDLTGDVTQCIDNAKRKLEDMPHAKKELNPLWALLNEPLFQILAAVGLLLTGVLNLVGRLLGGLGLGGLVDGLLGTLGLNRVLESLGLGSFTKSLKSSKKGGLLGGVLGG